MEDVITVENLNTITEFILTIPFIGEYLPVIFGVTVLASSIAAMTNTPEKGTWKHTLYTFLIDLPGLNVFKAKDKGDE